MATHTMALSTAIANQLGNQIELVWTVADPGSWDYFKDAISTVSNLSSDGTSGALRNGTTEADVGIMAAYGAASGGTLTVKSYIEIDGEENRLVRNEPCMIDLTVDTFTDETGTFIGSAALSDQTVDTSQIGLMPNTGAADTCHLWLEAEQIAIDGVAEDAEISSANDDSGRAHTMTTNAGGRPLLVQDDSIWWMHFDGSNDRIFNTTDWFHHNNFEIWFAFNLDTLTGTQTLYQKASTSSDFEIVVEVTSAGVLQLGLSTDGTTYGEVHTITTGIAAATSYVVGIGKNGATIDACINGFWSTISTTATTSVANGTGNQSVGTRRDGTNPLDGRIADVLVYSAVNSEPERTIISYNFHRLISTTHQDQAGVAHGSSYPAYQPYTLTQMPRKPIVNINLNSGVYEPYENPSASDSRDNLTGQAIAWWDDPNGGAKAQTQAALKTYLEGLIDAAIAYHSDFQIMFNRPGGRLQHDILGSRPFCHMTADQTNALIDVMTSRNLGTGEDGTRRLWFYVGAGPMIDNDFTYNNDADASFLNTTRVNHRVTAFSKTSEWTTDRATDFTSKHAAWTCQFLDAIATQEPLKYIQLVHSAEVRNANLRLVGEAFFDDADHYNRAPVFGLVGQGQAPWWINNDRTQGYNSNWRVNPLRTRVYFGVQDTGLFIDTSAHGAVTAAGSNDMSQAQITDFIRRGALPVAWPGTEAKVAAAWTATGNGRNIPGLNGSRFRQRPRPILQG